jgi:hypothetical protein
MIDDIYRQSILISKSALTKLNIKNWWQYNINFI